MADYIAYYRVSTEKQARRRKAHAGDDSAGQEPQETFRGLGLQAQREAVAGFIGARGQLLAEYTEVESGRRHTNRPQLKAALDECRKRRAVLIIAKLDRLARNVAFIANLMESRDVDFIAVDMPDANRLTIHVLAAVAEHEREMISQRTKAALAQAKAGGTKLGSPRPLEALQKANEAKNIQKPAPEVQRLMRSLHAQGKGLREIARELNRLNVRTPRGSLWYAKTIKEQLAASGQDGDRAPEAAA
jgi:DNA invertase Pin-like site-specific DNA recombinase